MNLPDISSVASFPVNKHTILHPCYRLIRLFLANSMFKCFPIYLLFNAQHYLFLVPTLLRVW